MTIRQLSAGIDSLYWSSRCGIAAVRIASLKAARDVACLTGTAQPSQETRDFALSIGPHGIHRYPLYVESHEFRVQVTDSKRLPTVYVQLRSAFIHEVGIDEAFRESVAVAEEIVARAVAETNVARLDLYGDFADWSLLRADLTGLVTNAKIVTHGRAGTDELETVMVGKSPMAVRLYRKDLEVRARGGFAPEFWGGYDGPVVRVEAQASREKPGKAVNRLLAEFPELSSSPSRRYEDEVLRKRALLPRSYRLAQEGRRVAFARDRSPSPEGGDSESSTVGSDA